ncbi:hypothetical protein [Micromonospora purpureochromogenes]|uniref:Tol biopolymer transport system component n=1 Tax=Micromonospora purpureochromogenes TaxID=47872 RepID=A0ABX2RHV6_9ACTN|nr:hypothetical protein [Micromonospora purpureochromogenes]NYF56090.1 Tol biopolymer transport system component [Micromonospora purpureochromogenes]
MNDQRLRLDLTDLAEEVTPVDLRDRALRTSRRIGIQRAIATSAAAVVLFGAATGTAFAILPNRGADPIPGTTPSVTASPSPTASPTPSPSGSPSIAPPATSTSSQPASSASFGRLHYGPFTPGGSDTAHLYSWTPGGNPVRRLALPVNPAQLNAAVSPDGRRVAWVEDGGALWTSALDGSGKRKLHDLVDNMCWSPTWSPNSRQLTVRLGAADGSYSEAGLLDVSSGTFTEVAGFEGCHPVWAANGTVAFADGSNGTVVVTDRTGAGRRTIPGLGSKGSRYVCFDVASISPDGRRIALFRIDRDGTYGDAARDLIVNAVLDTRTGKEISLPLGGRELRQAYFQADGSLVARVRSGGRYTLILVDKAGKKVAEKAEPSSLASMQIIAAVD